jgi:invasion protein IalB
LNLYVLFSAAVAIAAAAGALVVFLLLRSSPLEQQQATANRPAARTQAAQGTNAPAPVEAWLEVINQQSKQVMIAWIVGPDNKGALQTLFQTPTGVRVAAGVDVKLGNAAARHVNYITCLPRQCTAGMPMDDAFVKDTIAAQKADVTLYAPDGKGINFGIPVIGFDKAVAAIKK